MAGRRKFQAPPNDPSLNASYWRRFTDVAEPTVRNKLLFLTIDEVGRFGPAEFNGVRLCERLAVSPSLINHYFGGRDGLIAEATAMAYRSYVLALRDAAAECNEPTAALRAWIVKQIEWAAANPGLSEILNYSSAHSEVSRLIHRDYQREITKFFEFNMYVLWLLIRAIRGESPLNLPSHPDDVDTSAPYEDTQLLGLASSVAWSTLGAAVWSSGQHTPSAQTPETRILYAQILEIHIERIIRSIQ